MSVSDDEVIRLAHKLIDEYGREAWSEATRRYHKSAAAGDGEAAALWLRVSTAIAQVEDQDLPDPLKHRAAVSLR